MTARTIKSDHDDWPSFLVAHLLRRLRKHGKARMRRRAMRKGAKS